MKSDNRVKKLVLRKETLSDLTAHKAGEVKGGAKGGKKTQHCTTGVKATACGYGCRTYATCTGCCTMIITCQFTCHPC